MGESSDTVEARAHAIITTPDITLHGSDRIVNMVYATSCSEAFLLGRKAYA